MGSWESQWFLSTNPRLAWRSNRGWNGYSADGLNKHKMVVCGTEMVTWIIFFCALYLFMLWRWDGIKITQVSTDMWAMWTSVQLLWHSDRKLLKNITVPHHHSWLTKCFNFLFQGFTGFKFSMCHYPIRSIAAEEFGLPILRAIIALHGHGLW